jgi:restriction endonuclease S subunit
MENKELVSLKVNDDLVVPVIQKAIQAAIIENLGKKEDLIAKKVSSNGGKSNYSSDNKYDYMEVITNQAVQEAAKEALKEWLSQKKEELKEAVVKEMSKPSNKNKLVKSFADAAMKAFDYHWHFSCNINIKKEDV